MFRAQNEVFFLFVSEGWRDVSASGDCNVGDVCGEGSVEGWYEYLGSWVSFDNIIVFSYLTERFRCGWGSGALYYAEVLPNSKITAFSNSRTQKIFIDSKAKEKGLKNLTVITGNVVDYEFERESFDRVVSIEVCHMFQCVN